MKHLVLLIDGTWVTPTVLDDSSGLSNVFRLNLLVANENQKSGEQQIVIYTRGLGAQKGLIRYISGGFAEGIRENIEDVYINISSNYLPGDKVYIFGFSRGAVIARVVAALIAEIGLLTPDRTENFPIIWKNYKNSTRLDLETKSYLCAGQEHVPIEFLGVFDTVYGGSYDTPQKLRNHLQFAGKKLSRNVKHAMHIVAMNEQRPAYRPLLWEEDEGNRHPDLVQLWMPGVHSDIGGCYYSNYLGLTSLLSMVAKLKKETDLSIDEKLLQKLQSERNNTQVEINDEWSPFWKMYSRMGKLIRTPPLSAANQHIHPIVRKLDEREIIVRGHERKFSFDPSFYKLNEYDSSP